MAPSSGGVFPDLVLHAGNERSLSDRVAQEQLGLRRPAIEWFEGSREEDRSELVVERDAFTPDAGYPEIEIDGIPLRGRVWLSLPLGGAAMPADS